MKKLICYGTKCSCNKGKGPSLTISSVGNTIYSKNGKILLNNSIIKGSFGVCEILTQMAGGNPTPCAPSYSPWEKISEEIKINGYFPLTEKSCLKCLKGGKITLSLIKKADAGVK